MPRLPIGAPALPRAKAIFFTRLHYLTVTGLAGRGIQLFDNIYLTTDRQTITSTIPVSAHPLIGTLEVNSFRNSAVAIYGYLDGVTEANALSVLNRILVFLDDFEGLLWIHRDSCVGHEIGYLVHGLNTSSNMYLGQRSKANGIVNEIAFSADEVRTTASLFRQLRGFKKDDTEQSQAVDRNSYINPVQSDNGSDHRDSGPFSDIQIGWIQTRSNSSRLTRTLSMVSRAQRTTMLTEKITFYCSALEALLSTSQAELSHQIAERVALISEEEKDRRLDLYQFIKRCYSFRSKYIHGASIKTGDAKYITDMSVLLDATVRRCVDAAFQKKEFRQALLDENKLDTFMLGLIFD